MARAISAASNADGGKGKPFSAEQIIKWVLQICLALEHAHGLKVRRRSNTCPSALGDIQGDDLISLD